MSDKATVRKVVTPEFRVSFPSVFEPRKKRYEDSGKEVENYELSLLFAKDADLSKLKEAAKLAAQDEWGSNLPKKLESPFKDAGDYEYEGYEAGMVLIRTNTKNKPGVVDQNLQPILDASEFYAGCYARASIVAVAYEHKNKDGAVQKRGVKFYLNNVQKLRDGERFGGGAGKPEDDFGDGTPAPNEGDVKDDPFA